MPVAQDPVGRSRRTMDMSTFNADCPRCGTRRVMFMIESWEKILGSPSGKGDVLARCAHCARGVVATYLLDPGDTLHNKLKVLGPARRRPAEIAPSFPDVGAPTHTPEKAAEFYRQGMENLPGNPDAAGAMFRKTLEVALKEKFPDRGKMSLVKRIAAAAKAGDLTPDLADWAHQIRIDGNDAAHDVITVGQAKDMQVFTELVLRYLFELPGMLKEAQQRISKDKDNARA